jgi:hypothetical protein
MLSSMGDTSIRKFQRDMRSGGNTREFMGDTGRSEGATGVDAGRVRMGSPGQIQRDPEEIRGRSKRDKGRSGRAIHGRYEKIWRRQRKSQDGKSRTDTERSGGERGRSKRDKGRPGREIQGRYEKIWRRQRKSQDGKSMTDTERSGGIQEHAGEIQGISGEATGFMVNTDLREM